MRSPRSEVMPALTIQAPAKRGSDPPKVSLQPQEVGTFGVCECGSCYLDLPISASPPMNFRAQILAGFDRWLIENLSDSEPLTVADADDQARSRTALPGESLPCTADMAIVRPFGGPPEVCVTVFFTPSAEAGAARTCCPGISALPDLELDTTARYFAVLTALCEPELQDEFADRLPTSSSIASRLALSPRAVDSHIDYLVEKLDLPVPVNRSTGWKRRALIRYVRGNKPLARAVRTEIRSQRLAMTA
jgi:hypothetical protein